MARHVDEWRWTAPWASQHTLRACGGGPDRLSLADDDSVVSVSEHPGDRETGVSVKQTGGEAA